MFYSNLYFLLFLSGHLFLFLCVFFTILKGKYPKITNTGWFVASLFVPYLGSIAYILMRLRQYGQKKQKLFDIDSFNSDLFKDDFTHFDTHRVLCDDAFLEQLLKEIEVAEKTIYMTQFTYDGYAAQLVNIALTKAHLRGVKVYLIVDFFGSNLLYFWKKANRALRKLPFDALIFNPLWDIKKTNIRLHVKFACMDDKKIFIGSHNISDRMFVKHPRAKVVSKNVTILLSGDIARRASVYFKSLWNNHKTHRQPYLKNEKNVIPFKKVLPSDQGAVRLVFRNDMAYNQSMIFFVLDMINSSKKYFLLRNPYYVPFDTIRKALYLAVKRGVEVEIMLSINSDSVALTNSMEIFLKEAIDFGIKVHLLKPPFSHTKIAVSEERVLIGSSNFDYRSFSINFEANFDIRDKEVIQFFYDEFQTIKKTGKLKSSKISLLQRIKSNAYNLFSSVY